MSFKLLTDSFIDKDVNLPGFTFTSEKTSNPAENVLNLQRRSKSWRTNGRFEIVSGSNTIVFQEDASTDLTATITVSDYSSFSLFQAAVKSAMESASVNSVTYTISQTSSFKFTIASNGAGGATLDLRWSVSTAMADIMGHGTTDLTGALSYEAPEVRIHHPSERIVFDLGTAGNPTDFHIVGADRNKPLGMSPAGTYKLLGSKTSNFSGAPISNTLTYDDEVISLRSDSGLDPTDIGIRFWAFDMADRTNPNGFLELGSMFLGNHMFSGQTERGKPQFPFNMDPIDRSRIIFSEGGQNFSDEAPQTERFSANYAAFTKSEREDMLDAFRRFGKIVPFFVVFDPDANFSSSANRMVRYVQWDSEPKFRLTSPNYFTGNMTFREVL